MSYEDLILNGFLISFVIFFCLSLPFIYWRHIQIKSKLDASKAIRVELRNQQLISTMEGFIIDTIYNSERTSVYDLRYRDSGIKFRNVEILLEKANINLLNKLPTKSWKYFCKNITKVQNNESNEREGMHKLVNQIIQATIQLISQPRQYNTQQDGLKVDDEKIAMIPPISIILDRCKSKYCYSNRNTNERKL